jgi:hypothetical protein
VRTRDADIAFRTEAVLAGDLRTALLNANFNEELFGDDSPPSTHYNLGEEDELGVPVAADVDVLVPNPTSFIVQKLLMHSARPPNKKVQDILYIHDRPRGYRRTGG